MKIKRFKAATTRDALKAVKSSFGSDAVIMSNKKTSEGVEVVAAIDFNEDSVSNLGVTNHDQEVAYQASIVDVLQQEIIALKTVIENNFQKQATFHEPLKILMDKELSQNGMSKNLILELLKDKMIDTHIHAYRKKIIDKFRIDYLLADRHLGQGVASAVFIGLSGSGKTTALVKMASDSVRSKGSESLVIYTTDDHQASGYQQLKIYGDILGVKVHKLKNIRKIDDLINVKNDHVLIDTDPQFIKNPENLNFLFTLRKYVNTELKIYHVLPANLDLSNVNDLCEKLVDLGCGHIISKIEESTKEQLKKIICSLSEHKQTISYLNEKINLSERLIKTSEEYLSKIIFTENETSQKENSQEKMNVYV